MKQKISKIGKFFKLFLYFLIELIQLFFNQEEDGVIMREEEGEFTVTGTDSIDVVLSGEPVDVTLEILEDQILVPCDPHHNSHENGDHVNWYVKHYHRHPTYNNNYVLKAEWTVTGVRRIKWTVKY